MQKPMFQIGLKMFSWLKEVKNTVLGTVHIISDLKGVEIVGTFYEKQLQKSKSKIA